MSERAPPEVGELLRAMLAQQTAMLQVHAESLRLQRLLVERLLDARADADPPARPEPSAEDSASAKTAAQDASTARPAANASPMHNLADGPTMPASRMHHLADAVQSRPPADASPVHMLADAVAAPNETDVRTPDDGIAPAASEPSTELRQPARPPVDQHRGRGNRYYQAHPPAAAKHSAPEAMELMRRLQEMRDAGDLILQFGPYKGDTLAQVALEHPDYIRELMLRAQRPEVRAAAGRLVEALDAADEHKARAARGAGKRGRAMR